MLSVPGFHHLHLNSVDPEAAIAFYTRQFPSTAKASWGGLPALQSPNNVLILFTQVATPPATSPQTAIWHFGWHVTDSRARLEEYKSRPEVTLVPLYTGDDGGTVFVSSDTWPGTGGVLGLTKAQIADAKSRGVQPTRTGGFAYMQGPDNALVEYAGNHPAERFNHVHLFQEDPFCAQLWYQQHLNAPVFAGRTSPTPLTEATCKVERGPDRTFPALDPEDVPDAVGRGRIWRCRVLVVHAAGRAAAREQPGTRVRSHRAQRHRSRRLGRQAARRGRHFLAEPYRLGDTRAVMVEGPSCEAIELVEIS